MSKRAVIVGAGPGGLANAMLLAKMGLDVTVLEKRDRVGGRTSAITPDTPHGRFTFDTGPTFFLYPRVLSEIFEAVGRDLMAECPMTRLDPQYRLTFGAGGRLDCTPDIEEMERQVAALSPRDAGAFRRYMKDNRKKLERFRPILENPFASPFDLVNREVMKAGPLVKPWKSLGKELASYFSDPRLQIAFAFQSKYLGMSPFRCPSLFSILAFLEYEYGVWHPTGGCNAVMTRMQSIAEEMGVQFRLGEPVEEIETAGRKVVAYRTGQGVYPCDLSVINADFAHFMTQKVPAASRRRWSDRKIEKSKYSCSTFMLYLGVRGTYDLPHHWIHISKDYERNLHDIEDAHRLTDMDPSVYVQNAGVTDDTLAPEGFSTLYVLVPVTHLHGNVDWSEEQDRFRRVALDQLKALGLDDLEERIVYEKCLTPVDWRDDYNVYRGATFNLAHNLGQMLHMRPHNRFEDLEDVYLVGGGTHPGSGLPVIFESSRIAARLIAEDHGYDVPSEPTRNTRAMAALAGA